MPQKAQLFTGTIRSNLLMGKADATEDEMWIALEIAQAAEVVRGKAGGLGMEKPGRSGRLFNFSGRRSKRLTIARALIAQADILILDDGTIGAGLRDRCGTSESIKNIAGRNDRVYRQSACRNDRSCRSDSGTG